MNKAALIAEINQKKSVLCVGLDTDIDKLPSHLPKNAEGALAFNKAIIEATSDFAVSYKINTAFYECLGVSGWTLLQETLNLIPQNCFSIADAKRGDIGNTSAMYAKAFYTQMSFDAITINPYMGQDSVKPFLTFDGKWAILLGLTSNEGSKVFQQLELQNGIFFEQVLKTSRQWGTDENMMYVVGATKASVLTQIRQIIPNHFLLIPGVGAQGGSVDEVMQNGINKDIGLLINASRSVLYAGSGEDFADKAAAEAHKLQKEMANYL